MITGNWDDGGERLAYMSTNVSQEGVEAFEAQGAFTPGRMVAIHNGINTDEFGSVRLRDYGSGKNLR